MYTLYRFRAAFYECLVTVVIALLGTAAAQKSFLYYPLSEYTLHSDSNIFTQHFEKVPHEVVYVIRRNTLWSRDMFYQVVKGLRIVWIWIQVHWAIRSDINVGAPGGGYRKSFLV